MALPWVRLDTNVGTHDKILALKCDASPDRWQAMASYFVALAWSGGQNTDGSIPEYALDSVLANKTTARLLVKYRLWKESTAGWEIVNYADRQATSRVRSAKAEARRIASEKANCTRWHGAGCWRNGGCSRG